MELLHALVVIFATSSGLVCVYALVSSLLLFLSLNRLSPGEDFTKLVRALFFTVFVGFIYTLWNLLTQLGVINFDGNLLSSMVSNVLISLFFVMLAYLAFLTRQISTKFGFRKVGQEINDYLKSINLKRKKVVRRGKKK
ncbi:MAG: hypothetical protein QW404_02155 [Candidatus Nanoarchaeia archaeon]